MNTEEKIAALHVEYVNHARERADERFAHWQTYCQSPIERLLLAKLVTEDWEEPREDEWFRGSQFRAELLEIEKQHKITFGGPLVLRCRHEPHYVKTQLPVLDDRYTLDFAFFSCGEKFAIELDGHDFHEKTKKQASHDKRRDRQLVADGWKVFRYTGSDVYGDVTAVYDEIMQQLDDAVMRYVHTRRSA
jgi:very-short-patch-repair endonuclease